MGGRELKTEDCVKRLKLREMAYLVLSVTNMSYRPQSIQTIRNFLGQGVFSNKSKQTIKET